MSTTSRRRFLQTATAGAAAAVLADRRVGAAQAPSQAHGVPVVASIIDFHAHWVGPHVVELLAGRASPRAPQGTGWYDIDARLHDMENTGVERQVLAWVGGSFDGSLPPADARPLWRAQNDDLAALVKQHPARFSALASLPTANLAWATEELDRAHTELGLIGAVLPLDAFVSLAGARALAPIFAVAQKHRSHIFVHRGAASGQIPGQEPEGGANQYFGLPAPIAGAARPMPAPGDNASARSLLVTAAHLATGVITLALTDVLDAYPDVTVQIAMMGGAIASVVEHVQMAADDAGTPLAEKRLKRVYFDTGQSGRGPRGITLAAKVFGADRILFGTDSGPVATIGPTIASVKQADLSTEERNLIFDGNARRILRIGESSNRGIE